MFAGLTNRLFAVRKRAKMMVYLATCDSPFSLDDLAARIRKSSNFRFSWQFYHCNGLHLESPDDIRQAIKAIIATPALHEFLRSSHTPYDDSTFVIHSPHVHSRVESTSGELEMTLARAASDHLGAYSKELCDATAAEKQAVIDLFQCIGEYRAYELRPGNVPGCPGCSNPDGYLFSSWFYSVAWDWCLIAAWPQRNLLWVGCLTDTD